jgi:PERQ amino acid-rich with GYF domain-containing protein
MPRRQSLSSNQGPLASSRDAVLPSPRTRTGFGSGFDGVLGGGDSWTARRKAAEALSKSTGASREPASETEVKIKEEEAEPDIETAVVLDDNVGASTQHTPDQSNVTSIANETPGQSEIQPVHKALAELSLGNVGQYKPEASSAESTSAAPLAPASNSSNQNHLDLASVEWSYLDPQGNVQGKPSFVFRVYGK